MTIMFLFLRIINIQLIGLPNCRFFLEEQEKIWVELVYQISNRVFELDILENWDIITMQFEKFICFYQKM